MLARTAALVAERNCGLVFNSGAVHAAGEIDQRFFLVDSGSLSAMERNSLEPAVSIEDVVFGIVDGE